MGIRGRRFSLVKTLLISILLPACFIMLWTLPAQGSWNEFSKGLNRSFSGEEAFTRTSMAYLILLISMFIAVVAIFKWHSKREEQVQRQSYQAFVEHQRELNTKSDGQHKRRWFRLKVKSRLKWVPARLAEELRSNRYYDGNLVDISGDGLCFNTTESIEAGEELIFILDTGEGKSLSFKGRVIRTWENTDQGTGYNVATQFVNLKDGQRDRIVAWITKRQRATIHAEEPQDQEKAPFSDFMSN